MQFHEVFKQSNVIDHMVRVKLDNFCYLKGKLKSVVNLGYLVVHGGYLKGKLGSLRFNKMCGKLCLVIMITVRTHISRNVLMHY